MAAPYRDAGGRLVAPIAGLVTEVSTSVGERVTRGQVLVGFGEAAADG